MTSGDKEPTVEPTPEPGSGSNPPATDDVVREVATTAEAIAEDTAIFANEMKISTEEAAAALTYQSEFSRRVAKLLATGNVAWSEVDPLSQTGLVVFTGSTPAGARDVLADLDGVEIREGARFNVDEQAWRTRVVAEALQEFGSEFNVAPGLDQIEIDVPTGFALDKSRLLTSVGAISSATELTSQEERVPPAFPGLSPGIVGEAAREFDVSDFVVQATPKAELIMSPENTHGGEEMTWWNGSAWKDCTSGFTVRNSSYVRGVTTAGHCDDVDYIRDNQAGLWHTTSNFAGHVGGFGDFGWYQTSGNEDALFRASGPANYRSQQANPVFYAVGSYICFFGHKSYTQNGVNRTCNHKIEAHNLSWPSGLGGLSRVSNRRSIGGDSGGGYSMWIEPIGSHQGSTATKQFYSPMGNVLWWYNLTLAQ